MKYILATTYDVFGYLVPGIVATIGLYFLAGIHGLFDATDWSTVTATGWTAILFACYVVGLLLQSVPDFIARRLKKQRGEDIVLQDPNYIDQTVRTKAYNIASAAIPGIKEGDLWRLCETIVQLKGKSDTLDIYIYREGLYRGLIGAAGLVFLGLLCHLALGKELLITFAGIHLELGSCPLLIFCSVALLGCIGAFWRYRSFCAYRVRYCLYHVAFLHDLSVKPPNGPPT